VANEVSPGLTSLVKKVDDFVKENKKADACAFVVMTGKESDEAKEKLKGLAKEHKLEIPLTINVDGGLKEKLKLNDKVKNTILIYKKKKITANFALNEITEKDVESVITAAKDAVTSS
jgi:hypothetical protein